MFESGAICLYVADKYPQAGLLPPAGTHERGLAYQWSFFAYTELQARAMQVRLAGSPEAAEAPAKALREAVDAVDRAIDGKDFLVGDRFSVADLLVANALSSARRFGGVELPAHAAATSTRSSPGPRGNARTHETRRPRPPRSRLRSPHARSLLAVRNTSRCDFEPPT